MLEPKTDFPLDAGGYYTCIFVRGYNDKGRLGGVERDDVLAKEYGVRHLIINDDQMCILHFDTDEQRVHYAMVYL